MEMNSSCSAGDSEEASQEYVMKLETETREQINKIISLIRLLFGNHNVIMHDNAFSVLIDDKYIDFGYDAYLQIVGRLTDPYYLEYKQELGKLCIRDAKGYYRCSVNDPLTNFYIDKKNNSINFTKKKKRCFVDDNFSEKLVFDFADPGNDFPKTKYKMTSIEKLREILENQWILAKEQLIKKYSILIEILDNRDIGSTIMKQLYTLGCY